MSSSQPANHFSRELQLLLNVVEPDPEFQPFYLAEDACFLAISSDEVSAIEARLRYYFNGDLPAPVTTPLLQFIQIVKQRYPGWPDEWPAPH